MSLCVVFLSGQAAQCGGSLADFIKNVDEDLDAEDVTMVVEMLREHNKIKVSLTRALVASV